MPCQNSYIKEQTVMNKLIIRDMSILSFIVGLIGGLLVTIPMLSVWIFLAVLFLTSSGVYLYLKKKDKIGLFEPKEAACYGGITGFVAAVGFFFTLVPAALLFDAINSLWLKKMVWFSVIKTIFSFGIISGIFMIIMFVLILAVFSAIFNAADMMITAMIFQTVEGIENNKDDLKIDVEIK